MGRAFSPRLISGRGPGAVPQAGMAAGRWPFWAECVTGSGGLGVASYEDVSHAVCPQGAGCARVPQAPRLGARCAPLPVTSRASCLFDFPRSRPERVAGRRSGGVHALLFSLAQQWITARREPRPPVLIVSYLSYFPYQERSVLIGYVSDERFVALADVLLSPALGVPASHGTHSAPVGWTQHAFARHRALFQARAPPAALRA